jgi:hypothetical protein
VIGGAGFGSGNPANGNIAIKGDGVCYAPRQSA